MKKLDILVIRSFIGPFFATFMIALFVLIMQFFWLYIDDLVGKGLDFPTLMQLTGLVTVYWIPMALPLALLLSSIMTFGNLGETFEIVAIKSAGIPLSRFMRPLMVFAIAMSVLAFFLANNFVPVANLKLTRLKYDIIVSKPAFDIKEGTFYDKIDGYIIKLGKKEKNDSIIHDVVIFQKSYNLQDQVIFAEKGVMRITPDKKFLQFVLQNGWRLEERGERYAGAKTEMIRMGFKTYQKVFDLSTFRVKTSDSTQFYDPKMLSIRQLNNAIDSISGIKNYYEQRLQNDVSSALQFARLADSSKKWLTLPKKFDTIKVSYAKMLPDSIRDMILDRTTSQYASVKNSVALTAEDYYQRQKNIRLHEIEWHKKFTLSAACIVLFLIGAPLGSIIRKGGLGLPLVFSIIFFVTFHLLNTFGEKFAKEDVLNATEGMWLSTLILTPIGIFLTVKAMRDSQLFNKEFYHRTFSKVKRFYSTFKEQ
jgi:lipopolysaccharide export system permease protein